MAEHKRDYYEALGLAKGASDGDLKKAYRRLAKECHPDLHPGDKGAEARFKEINEAYEVLSDTEKRSKYDQFGHAGVDPNFGAGAGGGFSGFDMGDIFGSFFGGGFGGGEQQRKSGPRRGADVKVSLQITLEEAAFGCKKEISVTAQAGCDHCQGTGCAEGTTAEVCSNCQGTGAVRVQQRTMFGAMSTTTTCPNCRGEGKIIHQPCKSCGGAGAVRRQKKLSVNIPAGIDEGQAISLRGQGDVGKNGGPAGDLIVAIYVAPHAELQRRGNTIYLERSISFCEAALGAQMEIPTLGGKVKYNIPEGTQTGTNFRLREKGVPNLNGRGRGDQIVSVRVEVPRGLSKEQKEALRAFEASLKPAAAEAAEGAKTAKTAETAPPKQESTAANDEGAAGAGLFGKKRKKK